MALQTCHECGQQVSSEALSCPKCGARPRKLPEVRPGVWIFAGTVLAIFLGFVLVIEFFAPDRNAGMQNSAPVAQAVYTTTAEQLFHDYNQNEVATDEKMKGKLVEVSGIVKSIDKSFTDSIEIFLFTSDLSSPAVFFVEDSDTEQAARLRKGDMVTFTCQTMNRILNQPDGQHCRITNHKV